MISKTKYKISDEKIKEIFEKAGLGNVSEIKPLGAGEYNAVFSVTAEGKAYAIKIAPPPGTPVLTYEKDMMQTEVYWYETISEKTDIRTPKIYFKDFSRKVIPCDYFIMEKLEGKTLNEAGLSHEEMTLARAEIAQMLAKLHAIKSDKFGYIQNELYDNWYLALKGIFENLIFDCGRKGKKSERGERALALIEKYRPVLETVSAAAINYDLWDVNIICKREGDRNYLYWIDPERSFYGDPIFDFICMDLMVPFAKKDVAKRLYNSFTEEKVGNSREEQIRFAFANLLMGLIQETEKYYRYTPLHFGWWRNVISCSIMYNQGFGVLEREND